MGGGRYDFDVAREARSSNAGAFDFGAHGPSAAQAAARGAVHPALDPKGQERECVNPTPLVVAMDVTRSRGDDTKIIYDKLPVLLGQLEARGHIEGLAISFCAIGDATAGDKAPLQVGQFEADNRLDEVLGRVWIEEGGGGSGQESYELAAWYYAHRTRLHCLEQGRKGYLFFIGDEGFYPKVSAAQVRAILGTDTPGSVDVDSGDAFHALKERFHVFFIYPKSSFEERIDDIDAEIKARVEAAGGLYEGVDVRASLVWDNRNDLDLHVQTPAGEHIYYGHKRSRCDGWLDVDRNVSGETTKPVENVRWAKGKAPAGTYKVWVRNYRFHESDKLPTMARVEVEVNGKIQQFHPMISPKKEIGTASDVVVGTFDFDPAQRPPERDDTSRYDGYRDEVIKAQWESVLDPGHLLLIENPKRIIDVILGALAIVAGGEGLDAALASVDEAERGETQRALEHLARARGGQAPAADLSAVLGGA